MGINRQTLSVRRELPFHNLTTQNNPLTFPSLRINHADMHTSSVLFNVSKSIRSVLQASGFILSNQKERYKYGTLHPFKFSIPIIKLS